METYNFFPCPEQNYSVAPHYPSQVESSEPEYQGVSKHIHDLTSGLTCFLVCAIKKKCVTRLHLSEANTILLKPTSYRNFKIS